MSLNKEAISKEDYIKSLRPAAAMDVAFPYFHEWARSTGAKSDAGWIGRSPSGFDPAYYEAEISLPEP